MNPIDFAKNGDLEYFKNAEIHEFQSSSDKDGYSVLSIAAKESHIDCCREILRRCPKLLYHRNRDGSTVLHAAVRSKEQATFEMLKFFLDAEEKIKRSEDLDQNLKLLTMVNYGETALHHAVTLCNRSAMEFLVQADTGKELLRIVNNEDKNTALHLAVQIPSSYMAEILSKSYDYDVGLNKAGETPFLIALRQASYTSEGLTSYEIVRMMLEQNPNKATEQIGSRGWTALHHAAYNNNTQVIDLLIRYCPDCCEVVNYDGYNFLHIAAEHERVGVVRYALDLGSEKLPDSVLNGKTYDGKTPLHIAALKENKSLTECLLYDNRVVKNIKNDQGQKVLDAIHFDYDKVKAGVFDSKEIMQKMMKEQGEFDLVVSALIAAVTFTAGITIPGGYFSDGPSQGMAVLSKCAPFFTFVISNNFALMFSLYAVFSQFCAKRLLTIEDTVYQLNVATRCTLGAIFAMMVAFITGSYIVLASSRVLSIVACVQCCCFFVFAANAMSKMVPSHVRFWIRY